MMQKTAKKSSTYDHVGYRSKGKNEHHICLHFRNSNIVPEDIHISHTTQNSNKEQALETPKINTSSNEKER